MRFGVVDVFYKEFIGLGLFKYNPPEISNRNQEVYLALLELPYLRCVEAEESYDVA